MSRCDGSAGTVGGSISIIVVFEPNTNLPVNFSAFSMALDSKEILCLVVLVGFVLGELKGVASGGIGGVVMDLVRVEDALGGGGEVGGRCVMVGGL